ncbi:hypothetical protein BN973_04940 [Mycobacterium triplex]|uniref:Uncharacterized protein n=1 Tax=Mycobacterium triplex TaxID=47839 RepID=A0A024K3Y0_9MYCO|nr:hypothetical protein BN973_04940 [Mycobacterium triplex]
MAGEQFGGPRPHVVGQQQFTAGDRDEGVDLEVRDGPLIGDGEHPHLADLVAPELDAYRMFGGGREDVENATADGEFAAPADHVDAGVGQFDQPGDHGLEFDFRADAQRERLHQAQLRRHRLQQRTRGGHHHPQRRTQPGVVRMRQPAQHHQPGADRVDARRKTFVRQRFPGRENRYRVAEYAAQFGTQVVGFAPGGGDHQQRAPPGQRTGHEQARAGRTDQVQFGRRGGRIRGQLLKSGRRQR